MAKTNTSSQEILAAVEAAIIALPYPFCIFDAHEKVLLGSDAFVAAFEGLEVDKTRSLYEQNVSFEDITRARLLQKMSPDQVAKRLAKELHKLRADGNSTKDMKLNGKWIRRVQSASPTGQKTILAVPIEALVQQTQALSAAKKEMEYQALHDPLTDLPNRRALNAHLERVLKDECADCDVVVFHVDLDKFKLVNDTLGHDAGDAVLLEVSKILRREVRATDFVARVGGDEFVMVFTSLGDQDAIVRVAERLIQKMREPIYYDEQCCQIGASIGVAIREGFTTPEQIVMDADIALYEAKLSGRGRYAFFCSDQRAKHQASKKRVLDVREAIILNAFEPFFQPQICIKTGEIIGFEALARWNDREIGIRPTPDFLDAIEEANLFVELDEMIITKALHHLAEWDALELNIPRISVNLSTAMLSQPNLPDRLKWMCDDAGVAAERLDLEVLENVMIDDQQGGIAQVVGQLKAAGFQIALDDFGTGNASISSFRHLAPQRIKIAREFVKDIHKDEDLRTIMSALITLAQNLGMTVLCEGVEDQADARVLSELGCEYLQGFLIAKAIESERVPIWIEDYRREMQPIRRRA